MVARPHIALIGLMGTGKSTVGKRVADRLHRPFVDGDEELTARTGRTAHEIAEQDGIDELHELEAAVAKDVLARDEPVVFASSASTILSPEVREALRDRAAVVWLHAPPAKLANKLEKKRHRPDLGSDTIGALEKMAEERNPLFAQAADLDFESFRHTRRAIADAVVDSLT